MPERLTAAHWNVSVEGWSDVIVTAATAGSAKYAVWRSMSEAGYFAGRDGFWRMLAAGCRAWPATDIDVRLAADRGGLIAGRRALEDTTDDR